jgi:hypothetical protein
MAARTEVESRTARAAQAARKVKDKVQTGGKQLQTGIATRVEGAPLLFVGVALGAGFVAGGGLRATVTGPLARFGGSLAWKMVVLPAITATLTRVLGGALEGHSSDSDDSDDDE